MPLATVFALISHLLDTTIVADNVIAEAEAGEAALGAMPLDQALTALLKAARVLHVVPEGTDEYLFLRFPGNQSASSQLLNPESLDDAARAMLERRVSVVLPVPAGTARHGAGRPRGRRLGQCAGPPCLVSSAFPFTPRTTWRGFPSKWPCSTMSGSARPWTCSSGNGP